MRMLLCLLLAVVGTASLYAQSSLTETSVMLAGLSPSEVVTTGAMHATHPPTPDPRIPVSDDRLVWTLEAKEKIDSKFFLEDGKYFFVRAAEYLHFFDGENGREIWSTEIPDFEPNGLRLLWNKKVFLVSTENEEILCYDVYTGKIVWQQTYADIDQDDYKEYFNMEAGFLLSYGDNKLCIDPNTGSELWRMEFELDGGRAEKGLSNLYAAWGDFGKRFLFATEDGLLLVDAESGKTLWKKEEDGELTDNQDVEAVTFYGSRALIMYDNDMIGFLDVAEGKELFTRPQDIDDIEGYSAINDLDGNDYLLISMDDTQLMINLTAGAVAWETKPEELRGILTHHEKRDGGNVLFTFMRRAMMGAEHGTYMDLYLINAATGTRLYKQIIAYTEYAPATGVANFLSSALIGQRVLGLHDYGFEFTMHDYGDDRVYLIRGTTGAGGMEDPLTHEGEGEGLVRINLRTGEIVYRSYFALNRVGFRFTQVNFNIDDAPKPQIVNDLLYVVGAERVVCANMQTGAVVWTIEEDLGFPVGWSFVDNTIFLKVGKQAFAAAVNAKSGEMSVKTSWDKDPYRIYAIDPADGSIVWKIDFEQDPGLGMPVAFDEPSRSIFGADEEELFAVKLSRDAGGKKTWSFRFDDDGEVGELEHEDCYAVTQTSDYSVSVGATSITTTISYSATAELVLRPVFRGDHFIVFGPEGVCSIDLSGKRLWTTEWDWAGKEVTLSPTFLKNGTIVFMIKEAIQVMDESTGKILWTQEDDEDAKPLVSPNNTFLYMLEDEEVRVYRITDS